MKDPILKEIRRIKRQIAKECNYNTHEIAERARRRVKELRKQGILPKENPNNKQ